MLRFIGRLVSEPFHFSGHKADALLLWGVSAFLFEWRTERWEYSTPVGDRSAKHPDSQRVQFRSGRLVEPDGGDAPLIGTDGEFEVFSLWRRVLA